MQYDYDIVFVNYSVHGGSFHKLIHFHLLLEKEGLRSCLLLNNDAPLGLQESVDYLESDRKRLSDLGVEVLSVKDIVGFVHTVSARLYVFDSYGNEVAKTLSSFVRKDFFAKTAQLELLLDIFMYHQTDYVFLQHPYTLWSTLELRKAVDARTLANAKKILFAGNIFYEPICNVWTSDIRSRDDLFSKYSLDSSLPLCLWMPDRCDGETDMYKEVVRSAQSMPMNVLVKLHPWEYKNLKHGFDPRYGVGITSAEKHNVPAVEERDSSWALNYADVVIVSNSSVGLEMAWWEKPTIYLNPQFFLAQSMRNVSYQITDVGQLKPVLDRILKGKLGISVRKFKRFRKRIATENIGHSFDLHVQYIKEMLAMPCDQPVIGDMKKIKRYYRGILFRMHFRFKQILKLWLQSKGLYS